MTAAPVKFSVVVPMYGTERYLPELLASFKEQTEGPYVVEYLLVDDGSPDRSAEIAETWLAETKFNGQVIRQQNGGVSAARNTGIESASGDWVTFPDSDDTWNATYLASVAKMILGAKVQIDLVSANVVRHDEKSGTYKDAHALKFKFKHGNVVRRLAEFPDSIQSQAASAVFRRDLLLEHGTRFISDLHVAEDALFTSEYLLNCSDPVVGYCADARYYYRIRTAQDSAVNLYKHNPDFYFGRFEFGYLPLLRRAAAQGEVPQWLQMLLLYDLRWYFPREMNVSRKATHLSDDEKQQTLNLVAQTLAFIDRDTILRYEITGVDPEIKALWLGLKGESLAIRGRARFGETTQNAIELRYLFSGDLPIETVHSFGNPVPILNAKTRRIDYFGQTAVRERILWVRPVHGLTLELDGSAVYIVRGNYFFDRPGSSIDRLGTTLDGTPLVNTEVVTPVPRLKQSLRHIATHVASRAPKLVKNSGILRDAQDIRKKRHIRRTRFDAQTPEAVQNYRDAWLLMDRIGAGNDNAEYLYRHLRDTHPEINAWFVLKKESNDWARLKSDGFRLLDYQSKEHRSALLNARIVASSHLDVEIVRPIPEYLYRRGKPWQFVYLQHGVLQHNLSIWFNSKNLALLTSAGKQEHESIVEDGSDYRLTEQTVKLTGFPRHDALRELAQTRPKSERKLILLAPTWRDALFAEKEADGMPRRLKVPFEDSDYGAAWLQLMNHRTLKELSSKQGAEIVFLPHPNFRGQVEESVIPGHIQMMSEVTDLHALIAQAKVTVTDFSSIFFDAAIAESDVVYYQFDRDSYLAGGHMYVPGYWSYEDHGLGPVAFNADAAAAEVVAAFDSEPSERSKYRKRTEEMFKHVDGKSSERITQEITKLLNGK